MMNWTIEEEAVFAEIQRVSRLSRIQSIHLWKRMGKNGERAVTVAQKQYRPTLPAALASLARGRVTQAQLRAGRPSEAV